MNTITLDTKLTANTLRAYGARDVIVDAFAERWPHGATIAEVAAAEWQSLLRDECLISAVRHLPLDGSALALLAATEGDENADVRIAVARNAATPPELLARMARDPNEHVRAAVARNAATPPATLAELASDLVWHVRCAISRNPATPREVVEALAHDADPLVRVFATSTSESR